MLNRNQKTLISITVALLFIFYGVSLVNWNPSGQVRKVEPWQDWSIPIDPVELEAYEFAHSIKLPDEPEPNNFFKEGFFGVFGRTTSDEYFKHLCETEAGEFIYRTVEGVEGIYQMRLRGFTTQEIFKSRYAMEDPPGYTGRMVNNPHTAFANREGYKYFETQQHPDWEKLERRGEKYLANTVIDQGLQYWRYWPDESFQKSYTENTDTLESHYGFTWRGIRRPFDRENGIAGGELIVLDLETHEVLAVRRHFARTGQVRNNRTGINWEFAYRCPRGEKDKFWQRQTFWFVEKVLIPISNTNLESEGG